MRLPTRRSNPDDGATTAVWLRGDNEQTRPYFGELPGDDERAEQAEAELRLVTQERDNARLAEDQAMAALDEAERKVRVLRDEVARLTELAKPVPTPGFFDEPVLPPVPEHDLTSVEVGSTPLDTPATDWDEWLAAWDALPRRVPGEALAELEADQ